MSKVAVSYALNGQPGVSEATRARIVAIADEIGWRPNSAARALNGARANCVGLALCRPARILGVEPFFMELISGIEGVLADRSYALLLQVVTSHEQESEVYRRWWGESRIDGVFLVDLHYSDSRVTELERLGMPVVVIGHPSESGSLSAVWSDDGEAVRETVGYLVALGHRRIARVAGLPELVHTTVRDQAFARACAGIGEHAVEHVIVHTDYTGEEGARATRRLLSSPDRPTAIVYDNDIMAVAGLSVATEMGVPVPAELSLLAWDDSQLCRLTHPPLSAMSHDVFAFGAEVTRRLMDLVGRGETEHGPAPTPVLVPRGTTARAR